MTEFEEARKKRQQEYKDMILKRARDWYEELESRGENTSAEKVKRDPETLPIIWSLPIRRRIIDG